MLDYECGLIGSLFDLNLEDSLIPSTNNNIKRKEDLVGGYIFSY